MTFRQTQIKTEIMKKKECLIIAETESRGYVLEKYSNLEEAIKQGEYIFDLRLFLFEDEAKIEKSQLVNVITSYSFKEQFVQPENLVWGSTNGLLDVNVI